MEGLDTGAAKTSALDTNSGDSVYVLRQSWHYSSVEKLFISFIIHRPFNWPYGYEQIVVADAAQFCSNF